MHWSRSRCREVRHVVKPAYEPPDQLGEGPIVGWGYVVFGMGQYRWKGLGGIGTNTIVTDGEPFATKQEALEAPKTLNRRELDRSEYILMLW